MPGAALSGLVECFWTSLQEARPGDCKTLRVLPDGRMDILFDFSAPARPEVSIVGTMSRPFLVEPTGRTEMLGVRFLPGTLPQLLGLEASELVDGQAELAAFWGAWPEAMWERLAQSRPERRVALLARELGRRLERPGKTDRYALHCATLLEREAGNLSLAHLEKSTGLGARQLERKFLRHLGLSPKTFARVMRFRRLVAALETETKPDWAQLAARFGYSDQPHLARELREFSGLSPSAYWRAERQGA